MEHEAVGAMDYLRYLLDDIYQFRRYTYAPPQSIRDAKDIPDDSVEARKQDKADTYRKTIRHLKFAAYGWALNLFEEGDVSDPFIKQVFTEYVQSDFGSVNTLSELYFEIGEVTEPLNYWERWNLNRALEKNYGSASTGMAINTWLLQFYCTALVWVLVDQGAIDDLQARDPEESPLTEYDHVQYRVDTIIDRIDSHRDSFTEESPEPISRILRRVVTVLPGFIGKGRGARTGERTALQQSNRNGYPLTDFLGSGPSTNVRCDALIDYFEGVKSILDEQEQNWVRTLPISNAASYGENANSRLNSCTLRTAIEEVDGITQVETLDKSANAEFTSYVSAPRKVFVDDGVPTFFNNNFSELIERYRGLALDHLEFEEQKLGSVADVPDALAELASREAVALIVIEHMEVERILRDDERSDRSLNNDLGSYFSFMDIPVLQDITTEFAAVVFFNQGFNYVEEVDGDPIAVDVTPGENVDEWGTARLRLN